MVKKASGEFLAIGLSLLNYKIIIIIKYIFKMDFIKNELFSILNSSYKHQLYSTDIENSIETPLSIYKTIYGSNIEIAITPLTKN